MSVVKLYIGGLPPTVDDSTVADMLSAYGHVESVTLSRDQSSLQCLGFGFAKMLDEKDALKAIAALHNTFRLEPDLHPNIGPVQLRIVKEAASSQEEAVEEKPVKLFIGGVPGTATGKMVRALFQPYGEILDLFISPEKGYAFVKYSNVSDATAAVAGVNGATLPNGVRPLEVRIAQSTKGLEPEPVDWKDTDRHSRVAAVIQPQLPKLPNTRGDWAEYVSPEGKPYYHNTKTNTTTWEAPFEFQQSATIPPPPPPTPLVPDKGPAGSNIFVYGLPDAWREREFFNEFSKFGQIVSSKIIYDRASGASKGYGFISYTNRNAADSAVLSMHGLQMPGGKKLKVQIKKGEEANRPY